MRRYIYTVFVVVASLIACTTAGYTEELHLKPLRSRHTLAHFQFAVNRAKSDITRSLISRRHIAASFKKQ
jgi:hypothetical protein